MYEYCSDRLNITTVENYNTSNLRPDNTCMYKATILIFLGLRSHLMIIWEKLKKENQQVLIFPKPKKSFSKKKF